MIVLTELDRAILIAIVLGCVGGLLNSSLDIFLKIKIDREEISFQRIINGLAFTGFAFAILVGIGAFICSLDVNISIEQINELTITMASMLAIMPLYFKAIDFVSSKVKSVKSNDS